MPTRSDSSSNPILNGPYDLPRFHYATDAGGNLNYSDKRKGRRIFAPDTPQVPLAQQRQSSIFDLNDLVAEYRDQLVNLLRDEVGKWREAHYPDVTSRVTRDLLNFWFLNPERASWHNLFFAQREAVETAIWLNEVAEKSNAGTHVLNQLALAQKTAGNDESDWLPRVAFKMATGTGKTVVMACLILYHYLNRSEYRQDTHYSDYFLIVAPGITIRDRLSVLLVDTQTRNPNEARDYYRERRLVPRNYEALLDGINARLVITNFHAFEPRLVSGNKKSPFDGKRAVDGSKVEQREDMSLVLKRVLGHFKLGRRLLVLNDEAHHCYLPKAKGKNSEDENSEDENQRAAVWYSGLRECATRFQLRVVYDLSATPYYLSGSGYPAYSLFPWMVSDFGLVEAIEAGLVKIPFLPVDDNTQSIGEPILRNLYDHCKDDLPKKGQRKKRKDAKKEASDSGKATPTVESPPHLPQTLRLALDQFYSHYENYDRGLREQGERSRDLLSEPPVFIVVCNNTTVSKEVYKAIAGYEVEQEGSRTIYPGYYDLFSNYDPQTHAPRTRPPTLLIDSDALENSGQINEDFKRVFEPEIERFKREYRITHPEKSVDSLTDADLLREVVNTVGKRGALGSHVRCVVSVAMLTEGWDANTVTHIVGLRAFGSQLLCEQVAGRALRRRNYFVDPKTGRFPPEYAHIIGVPFKFFKGGTSELPAPQDVQTLRAMPDRFELEIRFPQIVGYRVEQPRGRIRADFSGTPLYRFDLTKTPLRTLLGNAFSADQIELETQNVLDQRDQQVIYWIASKLLTRYYRDDNGYPMLEHFDNLRSIAADWYANKVELIGETDARYKRFLQYVLPDDITANIKLAIDAAVIEQGLQGNANIIPIYRGHERVGSTGHVFGHTSKETFKTKKSHINLVVADTESWEQITAKTLEQLPQVESYVKNAFLGFDIPYTDKHGKDRRYQPDFIARVKTPDGERFNLIIEITGFSQDKVEKRYFVRERWLPAVNAQRLKLRLEPWHFVEISDIERIKNRLSEEIERIATEVDDAADREFWMTAQASALETVWNNEDDKIWDNL